MAYLSPDIILFGLFLALNLFIGLRVGRHVTTVQGFAIGNKDFSTGTVTSTIVATCIGGGFIFYGLQNTYTKGLLFIIPVLGGSISYLLNGQVLAIRMGEFLNNLSVAEAMGNLYGKAVRIITAISGILGAIGRIAIQFQVITKVLAVLLNIQGPGVMVAAAVVVMLYSAFGGIRSVVITDVFQFIVFSIFIPMLALIIWKHLKDPSQVSKLLTTNPIFSFKDVVGWNPSFLSALGLMFFWATPALTPAIFQRVTIARDLKQVKDAFTYAGGIDFLITMSVICVGVLLLVANPHVEPSGLINYIIATYDVTTGLKALIAIGITAMAMSTADSELNISAVMAVNDLLKPLKPTWKESMVIVRIFSFAIGMCALLLALYTTDLLKLLLLSASFYMPIVTLPLLLAIFGFRSTPKAVLIGIGAGFITVMFCDKLLGNLGLDSIIPGMLANLVFLMGSHYLLKQPGGWVGIKDKAPLMAARQARQEAWQNLVRTIKETKIYDYLQQNLPAYDAIYSLFGLYVLGATYACFFTIPDNLVSQYQRLYDIAAHSVLICTAGFLTYPAWPPTFRGKWFITYAWPAGMGYILFVVGTQLVLMSGFNETQVMILLLNLVITAFFLSGTLTFLLALIGGLIGYLVFILQYGSIPITAGVVGSMQFKFIYALLAVSTFLMALFRSKQRQNRIAAQKESITTAYGETKNELDQVVSYSQEVLKELDEHQHLFDENSMAYLRQVIYHIKDYMRLEVKEITLDQLTLAVKKKIALKDFEVVPQIVVENHIPTATTLYLDGDKIETVLVNAIEAIQQNNTSHKPIRLVIEEATIGHQIGYMKHYTKEIAALRMTLTTADALPPMQDIYPFDPALLTSQSSQQKAYALLAENIRIIDAHYGYAAIEKDTTQVYVLPINVRTVRGKVMELLREPAAADPAELAHPTAIRLEAELFNRLNQTNVQHQVITKALDVIKRYHAGVKRNSGEPFFTHPIAVALILLEYCQDQSAIVAALLHDTVEDTSLPMTRVRALFGDRVAFIVEKVTNLEDKMRRVMLSDHENVARLTNYEDKRAAYVKLADRLHNMRTIEGHSKLAKQKHIANETLSFFVPMALELGLEAVAQELKNRSLTVLGKKD